MTAQWCRCFPVIGYIGEEGEKIPEKSEKAEETPKAEKTEGPSKAETAEAPSKAVGTTGDILATPYAKKLAAEKGINLENVSADSNGIIHAREVLATPLAKPGS